MPDLSFLSDYGPVWITVIMLIWLGSKLLENNNLTAVIAKKLEGTTNEDVKKGLEEIKTDMALRSDQMMIKSQVEDLTTHLNRMQTQVDDLQKIACSDKNCPNRKT